MIYRTAVIGCGRIGCGFDDNPNKRYIMSHAGAYEAVEKTKLVGLVDIDFGRAQKYAEKFGAKAYEDYAKMVSDERPDIISVCTRNNTHEEIIAFLCERKVKAIFCEKPFTTTINAASRSIKRCEDIGAILQIDHQRRFDVRHQSISNYLRNGELGAIQHVTCYYCKGIANTCSHLFDLLRLYFGDAFFVRAENSSSPSRIENDPNLDVRIEFRNGINANVLGCDIQDFVIFEINIVGSLGRLKIKSCSYDVNVRLEKVRNSKRYGCRELSNSGFDVKKGSRELRIEGVRELVNCLENNRESVSDGYSGRAALEIISAAHKSVSKNGKRVELPLRDGGLVINSE